MNMGKNSWEDGASEHIPTHLKQLQTKADAYHKAGDIKSANALRDKIKIIKTKHGMAPASTQKTETPKMETPEAVRTSFAQKADLSKIPTDQLIHLHHLQYKSLKLGNETARESYERGHHELVSRGAIDPNYFPDIPVKPTQKTEVEDLSRSETRLAILAKGLKAAITLRGLVKAEKEISKDRYIVRFNDGKSASKKEFTKKGAAHSHAQKKIDEGYDNVTLHHYSVDNPTKETKLEIGSVKKSEQLDKASGLSPENQLKFTQNRAFSSTDNANQSNDKTAHSYARDFHNKSAEVANKVGKPHVAEYHKAIAKHHEEVANNPGNYQVTKPSNHTGLSPENKIKYSQNRADSSTEIAHGSNDATHHSNAAHFHRKASEVANSVGQKVLANYHNNIAKYHENESSSGGNK